MVFDEMHLQTIQHNLQQKPAKKFFFAQRPLAALIDAEVRKLKNL